MFSPEINSRTIWHSREKMRCKKSTSVKLLFHLSLRMTFAISTKKSQNFWQKNASFSMPTKISLISWLGVFTKYLSFCQIFLSLFWRGGTYSPSPQDNLQGTILNEGTYNVTPFFSPFMINANLFRVSAHYQCLCWRSSGWHWPHG